MQYPDRHHPCYFLEDSLTALGAKAEVVRNTDTLNCWGLRINGKLFVYLIDNRLPGERVHEDPAAIELMQRGVVVACAQKPDADRISARWLPLAATPNYRQPTQPVTKLYDAAFCGYVRDEGRYKALTTIARRWRLLTMQGVFGDDAVAGYWSAWCGVDVPTQYGTDVAIDWNMRCFEILALGIPLVTSNKPYAAELGLVHEENCFLYNDLDDLLRCIDAAIHPSRIGIAGAALVQERHTYEHRAKTVLEWLK